MALSAECPHKEDMIPLCSPQNHPDPQKKRPTVAAAGHGLKARCIGVRETDQTYQNPSNLTTGLGAELQHLAAQVRRLAPSHRYPEQFHENKSEIAHRLRVLSRTVSGGAAS